MCDSSSAICLAHNPVFHRKAKHVKVRHHFLRDHVEKGEIEMKSIDTKRQLDDIFNKPLDSSLPLCWGTLVFVIPMAWFEGGACDLPCTVVSFAFLLHFLHTHLSHLVSPVILACICSIMLITVLG
jgi:hypothetical protein